MSLGPGNDQQLIDDDLDDDDDEDIMFDVEFSRHMMRLQQKNAEQHSSGDAPARDLFQPVKNIEPIGWEAPGIPSMQLWHFPGNYMQNT